MLSRLAESMQFPEVLITKIIHYIMLWFFSYSLLISSYFLTVSFHFFFSSLCIYTSFPTWITFICEKEITNVQIYSTASFLSFLLYHSIKNFDISQFLYLSIHICFSRFSPFFWYPVCYPVSLCLYFLSISYSSLSHIYTHTHTHIYIYIYIHTQPLHYE